VRLGLNCLFCCCCCCCCQVVDDILDFTQTAEQLGKPQGQDLASGNLTAPVIYALQQSKELEEIIQSEYRVLCTCMYRF
jgi:geranylgeranyl pyrophosphate synthase